jgi:(2Fe-2S) ferredoxin
VSKKYQILVCKGPECGDKRQAIDVHAAIAAELRTCPLNGNEAVLGQHSCFGKCQRGPNVLVREMRPGENQRMILLMPTAGPGAFLYHLVKPSEAHRIVEEHVANGRPILEFSRRGLPVDPQK